MQNIQILFNKFWAIHMRIIPPKFHPSIFKTAGRDRGDRPQNSRVECVALEGLAFFLAQKMPLYLIINSAQAPIWTTFGQIVSTSTAISSLIFIILHCSLAIFLF